MQKLLFYSSKATNVLYSTVYRTKTWLKHVKCSGDSGAQSNNTTEQLTATFQKHTSLKLQSDMFLYISSPVLLLPSCLPSWVNMNESVPEAALWSPGHGISSSRFHRRAWMCEQIFIQTPKVVADVTNSCFRLFLCSTPLCLFKLLLLSLAYSSNDLVHQWFLWGFFHSKCCIGHNQRLCNDWLFFLSQLHNCILNRFFNQ